MIDRNDRLMHPEDDDVTEALQNLFEDEGIDIVLNARVKRVSGKSGQSLRIVIEQRGAEKTLEGSHLLVAAGRSPNTDGIGLELAGVELTDRGYIKVNERLQTRLFCFLPIWSPPASSRPCPDAAANEELLFW